MSEQDRLLVDVPVVESPERGTDLGEAIATTASVAHNLQRPQGNSESDSRSQKVIGAMSELVTMLRWDVSRPKETQGAACVDWPMKSASLSHLDHARDSWEGAQASRSTVTAKQRRLSSGIPLLFINTTHCALRRTPPLPRNKWFRSHPIW